MHSKSCGLFEPDRLPNPFDMIALLTITAEDVNPVLEKTKGTIR